MPDDEDEFTGRMAVVTGWGRLKYGERPPAIYRQKTAKSGIVLRYKSRAIIRKPIHFEWVRKNNKNNNPPDEFSLFLRAANDADAVTFSAGFASRVFFFTKTRACFCKVYDFSADNRPITKRRESRVSGIFDPETFSIVGGSFFFFFKSKSPNRFVKTAPADDETDRNVPLRKKHGFSKMLENSTKYSRQ